MKDKAGVYGATIGSIVGMFMGWVLFSEDPHNADKNVPKNVPVKNEWLCFPSPQLQRHADDALLNMEVMVCARDKPKE